MLGDTIDIKKDEKRYNQLLNEGMLPGAAIRRIENEKRLGIVYDSGIGFGGFGDITFPKVAIVGIVLVLGYSILTGKSSSGSGTTVSGAGVAVSRVGSLSIGNIEGIDLESLNICRQNGLM